MRLLRELPEIEEKILDGTLSLSVVAQAQTFFRNEAKANEGLSVESKREVLLALERKSSREAERELLMRSSRPEIHVAERARPVGKNLTELKLVVTDETIRDFEKLKGMLAHSHPNLSWGELVTLMAKITIEKLDSAREPTRAPVRAQKSLPTQKPSTTDRNSRYIPRPIKREVFRRDRGRCTNCGSVHAPEVDHIRPFALGGPTTLENLRLLCRNCNQRRAIETYGLEKIERAGGNS